jgi:hypothetical protein
LATLAFCVGFNILRYPVVWQAARPLPPAAKAEEPAPAAASPAGAALEHPAAIPMADAPAAAPAEHGSRPAPEVPQMARSMAKPATPACNSATGACSLPGGGAGPVPVEVAGKPRLPAEPIGWPAFHEPPGSGGGNSIDARQCEKTPTPAASSANQNGSTDSSGALVPVIRQPTAVGAAPAGKPADQAGENGPPRASSEALVRRLPPVNDAQQPQLTDAQLQRGADIPLYPTTAAR